MSSSEHSLTNVFYLWLVVVFHRIFVSLFHPCWLADEWSTMRWEMKRKSQSCCDFKVHNFPNRRENSTWNDSYAPRWQMKNHRRTARRCRREIDSDIGNDSQVESQEEREFESWEENRYEFIDYSTTCTQPSRAERENDDDEKRRKVKDQRKRSLERI